MTQDPPDIVRYQSDHDLLIRLDEKVDGLHAKLTVLTDDHEARIRLNEKDIESMQSSARTWRFVLTTAISVLGLCVGIIALYHK